MNALLDYQTALAAAVDADPVLRLAHAVAWLDPLWDHDAAEIDDDYGDPDAQVDMALAITRRAFPEIYFEGLLLLRTGGGDAEIDRLVCDRLNRRGIPLDSLEWLPYGVPLPAYGVEITDPDFWTAHPDTAPVLACFGVTPDPNPYDLEVPDVIYRAAGVVEASLREQSDPAWQQVAELIGWLFGTCQNSSVAMSYEVMAEIQPLSWDPDDVEFALEIITEADAIMADAHAALTWLNADPNRLRHLQSNIQTLYSSKGKRHDGSQLEWPRPDAGVDRAAEPEPAVLQLRDDAA